MGSLGLLLMLQSCLHPFHPHTRLLRRTHVVTPKPRPGIVVPAPRRHHHTPRPVRHVAKPVRHVAKPVRHAAKPVKPQAVKNKRTTATAPKK